MLKQTDGVQRALLLVVLAHKVGIPASLYDNMIGFCLLLDVEIDGLEIAPFSPAFFFMADRRVWL